jgi:hypothetical protein
MPTIQFIRVTQKQCTVAYGEMKIYTYEDPDGAIYRVSSNDDVY